jgi:hypothetical protein
MTCVCFRHLTAVHGPWYYQYLKISIDILGQMSIFEILSCVLSCFHDFSANSFPRFHFVFQKTVLFRTLLITIYQLKLDTMLNFVENLLENERDPRQDQ